ncbi:MAG: DUF421 domain-containing protein [Chloroflexota bacterium]|nr:DUF421 domain-containing protein [Chloroflexota bacterium]
MWNEIGLTWTDAGRIVVSAIGLYLFVLILIRVMGQRTMARLSSFDLAAVVALGAVIGRAILGYTPTLVAGALGLITLLMAQAITGQLRRFRMGSAAVNNRAYVLMAGDHIVAANLRRTHVSENEITAQLRLTGIRSRAEVACVILESTGEISVLRAGVPIEPEFLKNVTGAELVPATFLASPRN